MNGAQAHDCKLVRVSGSIAAGSTNVTNLAGVDCAGFDSVLFIVAMGTITAGAATSIKLQQSSDDAASDDYTDVAGTSVTIVDTGDDKLHYVELVRPQKRYVKPYISRATQNSNIDAVVAILSGAHDKPVTQPTASVGGGEVWVSPAEGTA